MTTKHRHWDSQTILTELGERRVSLALSGDLQEAGVTITLKAEDTAWDPSSTKRLIHGPAKVTYTEYADGGVHAVERAL